MYSGNSVKQLVATIKVSVNVHVKILT